MPGSVDSLSPEHLCVAYQPQVDLGTNELRGVEILGRWQPAEGGPMSVGPYVEALERSGAIVELDLQALQEAISARDKFPWAPRISANLSPVTIQDKDILPRLLDLLPTNATFLEIELTEGMPFQEPERAGRSLERLRARGVRIALDNFGQGHSDLGRLQRFPVDTIKVDRAITARLGRFMVDALVTATVDLCERASLDLVFEGVETREQADALRKLGARQAQGFFFSTPMTAAELQVWPGSSARDIEKCA